LARSASVSIENTASKGLITEATGLNFPENAWTDALNVVPDNRGMTRRRLGINYEYNATENDVTRDGHNIASSFWRSVGGDGDLNFVVAQVGNILYFYEESEDNSLSSGKKDFTVDLDTFKVVGAPDVKTEDCQFSFGKGFLFVTHPFCEPFFVSYDPILDEITSSQITIKTRDFIGVDDGLGVRERPNALSDTHRYNLYNQGWFKKVQIQGNSTGFPIVAWDTFFPVNVFPSNSDIWWLYKDANDLLTPDVQAYKEVVGQSQAPKGYFILDHFNQDRTATITSLNDESNTVPTIDVVTSSYFRPKTCAFFSGRVFFSGVNYQDYVGEVYFSQIIDTEDQFGKCYQDQDPTSETFSDLLATDGGVIRILDSGTIYKIFASNKSLLVFAANGVWSISGTETSSFKATEYTVTKVSGVKTLSSNSFVDVQGFPVWWNQEGIFIVTSDDFGAFKLESLTDTTIKTFFNLIPLLGKTYCKGAYDPVSKIITWVYSSSDSSSGNSLFNFNKVLSLNTLTGAFYPWSLNNSQNITINGVVISKSVSQMSEGALEEVVDNSGVVVTDSLSAPVTVFSITTLTVVTDSDGNPVVDSMGEDVTALTTSGVSLNYSPKFIVTRKSGTSSTHYYMSFAEEYVDLNKDWQTLGDGYGYNSFYNSGYKLHTDAQRFGQTNYIIIYANNRDNASAFLNVIWDYGKITGAVNQIYRLNLNLPITQTKIMLRGRGRVFQFNVSSDEEAPFEIIGWSVFETQNSSI
jgi:hypothetical protein